MTGLLNKASKFFGESPSSPGSFRAIEEEGTGGGGPCFFFFFFSGGRLYTCVYAMLKGPLKVDMFWFDLVLRETCSDF